MQNIGSKFSDLAALILTIKPVSVSTPFINNMVKLITEKDFRTITTKSIIQLVVSTLSKTKSQLIC